ncbi:MAG: hypothetical protein ACTTJE_04705, partial [Schwartzia sp. (in: firmicutes)]
SLTEWVPKWNFLRQFILQPTLLGEACLFDWQRRAFHVMIQKVRCSTSHRRAAREVVKHGASYYVFTTVEGLFMPQYAP